MDHGDMLTDVVDRRKLVLGRLVQEEAGGDAKQDPLTD